MPECLSNEDERPVSLFSNEGKSKNQRCNGDVVNGPKRPADTEPMERLKSPKITDSSTKEISSKSTDAGTDTTATTTSTSTVNSPKALSPETSKKEETTFDTKADANPKNESTKSSEAKEQPYETAAKLAKYTLGNLINSLIAKNVPAQEDMEQQLIFKSNFNIDSEKKTTQDQQHNIYETINTYTNNNGQTPTNRSSTLQDLSSDNDSIYSSPSKSNTPGSEDETSGNKSQTESKIRSVSSYSDTYSDSSTNSKKYCETNKRDGTPNSMDNLSAKRLLQQRQSPNNPESSTKRRASDADENQKERPTVSMEHDPYMFLSRLKKPRLATDYQAGGDSIIIPPWKINNGNLDNIIEQEFILDHFHSRDSSDSKKLFQGSVFNELKSQRSVTPGDSHQLPKQGKKTEANDYDQLLFRFSQFTWDF